MIGHLWTRPAGVRVDGPPARGLCRRVVKGKVLKMDGPSAQGFLSLTGPLVPRVADCPAVHSEHILHYANWICKGASAT